MFFIEELRIDWDSSGQNNFEKKTSTKDSGIQITRIP